MALAGTSVRAGVMYWQIGAPAADASGAVMALARARVADGSIDTRLDVWDGDGWRMRESGEGCGDALFDPLEFGENAPERMFVRELVDDTLDRPAAAAVIVDLDNADAALKSDCRSIAVSNFNGVAPTPFIFWNAGTIYGY